jgi:collagenase-like PrtC family protease
MEITVGEQPGNITLGPVLFNWKPETWRDFYFRVADEAPVTAVYLGETVCSKRAVLFEPYYRAVAERLSAGGKDSSVLPFTTFVVVTRAREAGRRDAARAAWAVQRLLAARW